MYLFYTISLSMALLTVWMTLASSVFSLVVMLAEITGLETPQARPRAALEATKTYETFLDDRLEGSPMTRWDCTHLLFAKQREMEKNFQRLRVRSQNDNFCDTTVQSLRSCSMMYVNSSGCNHENKCTDLHWLPSSAACTDWPSRRDQGSKSRHTNGR